ncbi:MAG: hypothetical protein UW68_C0046G0005 [Candidatus Collierbacteria bacterium GW2011_GWB1_44_6]|uniref:Uncharacterized protein n=1 Tax=Candidatus Collierbacteria bacterium GW2011_GWB1_44_6 TaxID=1618384 RepID=A0A0G1LTH5_9BACT|nr:MAG: hypothetical protein UW68_C0046G0005 [Candidatus Collierbacteria bacterium GW2011_GWB1_44_6]
MNEISKKLMCVSVRNGVELWFEKDEIEKLQQVLSNIRQSTFVHFGERTINTADIVGIFLADDMGDVTNRKNGKWRCDQNFWHEKGKECDCIDKEQRAKILRQSEAIAKCGKCNNGHVFTDTGATLCDCIKDI